MTVKRIRLSDADLARKATLAKQKKERARAILEEASRLEETIMGELERRKTRVVEHNGVKITRSQTESVIIDDTALLARLTPAQRKLCRKTVFDKKGLEAAVQAGIIPVATVSKYSTTKKNNPYLTVTAVPIR